MTPANRAELRGESEREGRKGARVPSCPLKGRKSERKRERDRERKRARGEKEDEGEERDANEEGEKPARASGRSLGPRVPRHGLVSLFGLHGQRSSSSTSHLRVLNLLPRESRRCRLSRINHIINDRSRVPRDASPRLGSEARNSRHPTLMGPRRNAQRRRVIRTSASAN